MHTHTYIWGWKILVAYRKLGNVRDGGEKEVHSRQMGEESTQRHRNWRQNDAYEKQKGQFGWAKGWMRGILLNKFNKYVQVRLWRHLNDVCMGFFDGSKSQGPQPPIYLTQDLLKKLCDVGRSQEPMALLRAREAPEWRGFDQPKVTVISHIYMVIESILYALFSLSPITTLW